PKRGLIGPNATIALPTAMPRPLRLSSLTLRLRRADQALPLGDQSTYPRATRLAQAKRIDATRTQAARCAPFCRRNSVTKHSYTVRISLQWDSPLAAYHGDHPAILPLCGTWCCSA